MTWQLSSASPGLTWRQGAICTLLVGAIGVGGWWLFEYRRQEQNYQALLNQVEARKAAQDYQACQDQARQISSSSQFYRQAQARLKECVAIQATFDQAQKLAEVGQFNLAIDKVAEIADPTATTRVNQSISIWSEQTLQKAQRAYEDRNGRLQDAQEIAGWIRPSNPFYQQAQDKIKAWNDQWSRNKAYWEAAKAALDARQFDLALAQIQQVDHPYWQQQALPISTAISVYTSLIAALPSPQPVQSDVAANPATNSYTDATFTEAVAPKQSDAGAVGGAGDGSSSAIDPYGNWSGEWPEASGADVASLTLKFLIPLTVPLMLGLGRPRN